jgi:hypothetical protein
MRQQRLSAALIDVEGGRTDLVLDVFGVVDLFSQDRARTVIREAACVASIDGVLGAEQFETHWTGAYLDQLVESPDQR